MLSSGASLADLQHYSLIVVAFLKNHVSRYVFYLYLIIDRLIVENLYRCVFFIISLAGGNFLLARSILSG